ARPAAARAPTPTLWPKAGTSSTTFADISTRTSTRKKKTSSRPRRLRPPPRRRSSDSFGPRCQPPHDRHEFRRSGRTRPAETPATARSAECNKPRRWSVAFRASRGGGRLGSTRVRADRNRPLSPPSEAFQARTNASRHAADPETQRKTHPAHAGRLSPCPRDRIGQLV